MVLHIRRLREIPQRTANSRSEFYCEILHFYWSSSCYFFVRFCCCGWVVGRLRVYAPLCDAADAAAKSDNGNGMAFARSGVEKVISLSRVEWLGSPFMINISHNTCNLPYYPHPLRPVICQCGLRAQTFPICESNTRFTHTRVIDPNNKYSVCHRGLAQHTQTTHRKQYENNHIKLFIMLKYMRTFSNPPKLQAY